MGQTFSGVRAPALFKPRHIVPRACVLDDKPHIRTFISDMLDELGFVTETAPQAIDIRALLQATNPSVIVVSISSAPGSRASQVLMQLAAEGYRGNVMLFGGRASEALVSAQSLGEKLKLAMLSPLCTPFRDADMASNLSVFLPIRPPLAAPIDVAEALENDWLELWYQPKIDPQRLELRGAEALIRMRHPDLGVVPPAYFIPPSGDPQLSDLSEFVVQRAAADWMDFAAAGTPIEIAINPPLALLRDARFVDWLRHALPKHPHFPGLVVEIDSAEVVGDPVQAGRIAKRLVGHNIRVAITDAATACASLASLPAMPFAELKIDWTLIHGCSDALKRAVCMPLVELADRWGASAVAVGIEGTADLEAVRDMGFDLVQGFLFAGPMEARKFARTMLVRREAAG